MKAERVGEFEGLIGLKQKRLIQLGESLQNAFSTKVRTTFQGERLIIEIDGKTVWLDADLRITGEAVTPS